MVQDGQPQIAIVNHGYTWSTMALKLCLGDFRGLFMTDQIIGFCFTFEGEGGVEG